MKSFLFTAFLLVPFGITAYEAREYVLITVPRTWNDAQMFCRTEYTDLAVVTNKQEDQQIKAFIMSTTTVAWIGLKRQGGKTIWKWSDGTPTSYINWYSNQPNINQNQDACVNTGTSGWNDQGCMKTNNFFCYRSLTLVEESMTWDEALAYCRSNFTGMASLPFQSQLDYAGTVVQQSQIHPDSVWTGLHFQDGLWYWLNKMSMENVGPLFTCPNPPYRCGARNFNTGKWEFRDCNDKLYFFCF